MSFLVFHDSCFPLLPLLCFLGLLDGECNLQLLIFLARRGGYLEDSQKQSAPPQEHCIKTLISHTRSHQQTSRGDRRIAHTCTCLTASPCLAESPVRCSSAFLQVLFTRCFLCSGKTTAALCLTSPRLGVIDLLSQCFRQCSNYFEVNDYLCQSSLSNYS